MKILYISNQRLPTEKAYGIQIAKTCEALADAGAEVKLLFPSRKNRIKDDISVYYSVKNNFGAIKKWAPDFYLPGKFDRIAFEIKMFFSGLILALYGLRQDFDIAYSRDEWPLFFLGLFGKKVYFEAHKFSRFKTPFYRFLMKRNGRLVVITRSLKENFLKTGFREEDILTAPDGVDLTAFNIELTKDEARRKTGLPSDKKIVMYTGHLYDWKGVGVLVGAAQHLKNNELLVLVGGTDEDLGVYKYKIKESNLESRIFLAGHKPHGEIPIYLKAADVLVLPNKKGLAISEKYTSPLKLFEYLASGRPIVASDLSSLREILNSGNSILVEPNDPEALAHGIRLALENSELSIKISQQALVDSKNYSWQKRAEKILNFLD